MRTACATVDPRGFRTGAGALGRATMVTDKQVRLLRKKRMQGKTLEAAAVAAGMTEKTARCERAPRSAEN